MTCQFAFLKERNIICPWINFISQLPWKFWKCLLIIANLQGVICAVKRSVAKVTFCTGAKTLTRACPPIGTAVDNIWLTFSFVLTDNTSVWLKCGFTIFIASATITTSTTSGCENWLAGCSLLHELEYLFQHEEIVGRLRKKNDPAKRPVRCRKE